MSKSKREFDYRQFLQAKKSIDENVKFTDEEKEVYKLWSPFEVAAARDKYAKLEEHGLLSMMLGDYADKDNTDAITAPFSKEEKQKIIDKIELANKFLDYADDDQTKKDLIALAADASLEPKSMLVSAAEVFSKRISEKERKKRYDEVNESYVKAEKIGRDKAEKDAYNDYKVKAKPERKLTFRTLYAIGAVALAGAVITMCHSESVEEEQQEFIYKAKPVIEKAYEKKLLEKLKTPEGRKMLKEQKIVSDSVAEYNMINFIEELFTDEKKQKMNDYESAGLDSNMIKEIETKEPISKPSRKINPNLDNILKEIEGQLSGKNNLSTFSVNNAELKYKFIGLTSNTQRSTELNKVLSMSMRSDDYMNLVSKNKLDNKISKLKDFAKNYSNTLEGFRAQSELAWLIFDQMSVLSVPPEGLSKEEQKKFIESFDAFKEYDKLIRTYGDTELLTTDLLNTVVSRKWAIEWWNVNADGRSGSTSAKTEGLSAKEYLALETRKWLGELAQMNNSAGFEANYFLGQIYSKNNALETVFNKDDNNYVYLGQELIDATAKKDATSGNNEVINYFKNSARGDSLRVSRAKYSLGLTQTSDSKSAMRNYVDAIMYSKDAKWVPQILYNIADIQIKSGNFDVAESCITVLNESYPYSVFSRNADQLKTDIEKEKQKVSEQRENNKLQEYESVKKLIQKN